MIKVACDYNIKEDIGFILESEKINNIEFAERAKVSRTTLEGIVKKGIARDDVCEKIYAYAYNGTRMHGNPSVKNRTANLCKRGCGSPILFHL